MLFKFLATEWFYVIGRVVFGVMFLLHGIQKLSGMEGFMWFIGLLEAFVGIALALGLFTRLGAAVGAIIMIGALITAHPGLNPLTSGGELAVCYLLFFLIALWQGGRKLYLEKSLFKKEIF